LSYKIDMSTRFLIENGKISINVKVFKNYKMIRFE